MSRNFYNKIFKKTSSPFFLRALVIAFLVFLGFYKVLNFSFHANREMGWLIGLTGGEFTFTNLLKSHGFISYLNYKLYGSNPTGWYLTAILLHIMASTMLMIFVNSFVHNKKIAFFTGIWFSVSLAWHDVITFGTQESMYSAQLFLFFFSLFFYQRFREGINPIRSYFLSLIALIMTLPLRELGLIFFPLLVFFDFIFYYSFCWTKSFKKNFFSFKNFILPQLPFILIALGYFIGFNLLGGSPNYFADERVKFKHRLVSEGHYLEYVKISIASFGTYLPPHIVPYPLLNLFRELTTSLIKSDNFKIYFFSLLGYVFYFTLWILALKTRKNKKIFRQLLFALTIITVPTFFYSTAVSMDKTYFLKEYYYDENRWRYFAFAGTSLYLAIYLYEYVGRRIQRDLLNKLMFTLVACNLIVNISFLWNEQDKMYSDMFKSQKLFYKTFLDLFPDYPRTNILYAFPNSPQLGDYLMEWYYLRDYYYPKEENLRKNWIYSEMEKVLKLVNEDPSSLENLYFIDFNRNKGVLNYTKKVRAMILNPKRGVINYNKSLPKINKVSLPISGLSPIEFPYTAEIILKANLGGSLPRMNADQKLSQRKKDTLIAYTKSRLSLQKTIKVQEVCGTRGGKIVFEPKHLIDGNFGERSRYWADCLPAWFILDLGKIYEISGFIIGGIKNDSHIPEHYSYEISTDGLDWNKVMETKDNRDWEIMDEWPRIYKSRYIKVTVFSTKKGSFVQLDEAEPVLAEAGNVFNEWTSRQELIKDMHNHVLNDLMFGKLTWETNFRDLPEEQTSYYFPVFLDDQYHTYKIPIYESEYYSLAGQFLKRRINQIKLDFSHFSGEIYLESVVLRPNYPINK